MNKTDLINAVAEQSGLTKKDSKLSVETTLEVIIESLKNHEKVQLIGFGNFEVRERKARKARNPQTGEEIMLPDTHAPAWKPAKAVKEIVKS